MTWSYTVPGDTDKDSVRFLLQDVVSTEPLLSDEEIQYAIDTYEEVYDSLEFVAAYLADTIAARYAREASYSADGVSINLAQQAQQFRDLAANLRTQRKNLLVGGFPDVGGITPYEEQDPEIAAFSFGTGMHDNLEAGPQDYGGRTRPYYDPYENPGA